MADFYMKLSNGLDGESQDSKHQNWIELLSFSHDIKQPASATVGTAGGGTTARTQHGDYTISKYVDISSPKLYEFASSGQHVDTVSIEMMRAAGADRVKYMQVDMTDVVISMVAPSGGATATDSTQNVDETQFPVETVKLNYSQIKWTYTQQKREGGTAAGQKTGGWSLKEHKAVA
jgi:type VI secretion system secreted protein Hcp